MASESPLSRAPSAKININKFNSITIRKEWINVNSLAGKSADPEFGRLTCNSWKNSSDGVADGSIGRTSMGILGGFSGDSQAWGKLAGRAPRGHAAAFEFRNFGICRNIIDFYRVFLQEHDMENSKEYSHGILIRKWWELAGKNGLWRMRPHSDAGWLTPTREDATPSLAYWITVKLMASNQWWNMSMIWKVGPLKK